jgi:hypothetical protein
MAAYVVLWLIPQVIQLPLPQIAQSWHQLHGVLDRCINVIAMTNLSCALVDIYLLLQAAFGSERYFRVLVQDLVLTAVCFIGLVPGIV